MTAAAAAATTSPYAGPPGYDGYAGPATPQEQAMVSGAVSQIRRLLGDQGLFGTSRNDDVHAITGILNGLSGPDRDAVVSKLSDQDLKTLAGDINHGGIFGAQGLSDGERTDLFNTLARSLSGQQLARVSQSLSNPDDIARLGGAVATFSTNDVKAGFVQHMAGQTTSGQDGATRPDLGSVETDLANPSAQSVGQVLASLKGDSAHFDAAVDALSDGQLAAVAKAGAGQSMTTTSTGEGGAVTTDSYDPKVLAGVLNAAATSNDPAVKARVFMAGAQQDGEIAGSNGLLSPDPTAGDSARMVTGALQNVMQSDPRGVVDQLQIREPTGHGLTTFVKQELAQGSSGQATVGKIMGELQRGPGGKQNPVDYISAQSPNPEGVPYYRNAADLGYFSGATQAAINSLASDVQSQAQMIGGVFSAAVGVASKSTGPVGSAAIGVLTSNLVGSVTSDLKSGVLSMSDAFEKLAYPNDPRTGLPYQGPAQSVFDSTSSRVINSAH